MAAAEHFLEHLVVTLDELIGMFAVTTEQLPEVLNQDRIKLRNVKLMLEHMSHKVRETRAEATVNLQNLIAEHRVLDTPQLLGSPSVQTQHANMQQPHTHTLITQVERSQSVDMAMPGNPWTSASSISHHSGTQIFDFDAFPSPQPTIIVDDTCTQTLQQDNTLVEQVQAQSQAASILSGPGRENSVDGTTSSNATKANDGSLSAGTSNEYDLTLLGQLAESALPVVHTRSQSAPASSADPYAVQLAPMQPSSDLETRPDELETSPDANFSPGHSSTGSSDRGTRQARKRKASSRSLATKRTRCDTLTQKQMQRTMEPFRLEKCWVTDVSEHGRISVKVFKLATAMSSQSALAQFITLIAELRKGRTSWTPIGTVPWQEKLAYLDRASTSSDFHTYRNRLGQWLLAVEIHKDTQGYRQRANLSFLNNFAEKGDPLRDRLYYHFKEGKKWMVVCDNKLGRLPFIIIDKFRARTLGIYDKDYLSLTMEELSEFHGILAHTTLSHIWSLGEVLAHNVLYGTHPLHASPDDRSIFESLVGSEHLSLLQKWLQ